MVVEGKDRSLGKPRPAPSRNREATSGCLIELGCGKERLYLPASPRTRIWLPRHQGDDRQVAGREKSDPIPSSIRRSYRF